MNRNRLQKTLFAATIAAVLLPAAYASAPDSASRAVADNPTELSEITVTGIRESLRSAQAIKQDSQMVVDSIVAEDIGKLPDSSVADALQRIPGVQVAQQGQGGETDTIVIRGLPNVVTTLNGNEIFSGIGRELRLPKHALHGGENDRGIQNQRRQSSAWRYCGLRRYGIVQAIRLPRRQSCREP